MTNEPTSNHTGKSSTGSLSQGTEKSCKSLRPADALGADVAARYARRGNHALRVDDRSALDTPLRDVNCTAAQPDATPW